MNNPMFDIGNWFAAFIAVCLLLALTVGSAWFLIWVVKGFIAAIA